MLGLKKACLYSFKPHRLGFCGPQGIKDLKTISDYLKGKKVSLKKIKDILKKFEGAYPYYQLIARSNRIQNPFDQRVVEAYWIGNGLLDKVKFSEIKKLILEEFTKPHLLSLKKAQEILKKIPYKVRPHHSFHVFKIGSITGVIKLEGKILDLCRVSWGKVKEARRKKLLVEYPPLISKKNKLSLGKYIFKEIEYQPQFLPKIKEGNWISFHWNLACEKLTLKQVKNLKKYTLINLR